jgi:predicted ATPase/DNA-binding winged helix-turn-helix (wHTH) protein
MEGSLCGMAAEVVRGRSDCGQTRPCRPARRGPAESAAVNAPEPTRPSTAPVAPPGPVAFGPFLLDAAQARLLREGQAVALAGRPLQVLALLAARAGQLVDKDAVLDGVWGHRHVTESVLKGAVNTLRMALGDDAKAPRYVETVPRRGYRFIAPLQAPAAAAPAPAPAVGGGNLPPVLPGLVGREAEAAQLGALLQAHRLVTLTGLGGVGKTRLALAVAAAAPPPQGVWLVRLDALADAEPLVSSVAQALALGAGAGASPAALARGLAPLQLRLVLDNAEHVLEPVAALAAELLAAAPGLRLLVTSQRPLHLAGEQVLQLAPLALPDEIGDAAPDPAGYAAARLFCERVRQALPDHAPTAAEHADIAAICRGLDGVPLALELAAARVPLLGVAGVRARLDQRFALLTRGPRDAAARHRTLAAALDWTCGLLGPAELRALQWLALLHGSFGIDAAEALLAGTDGAEPLDLVDALRERSLLVVEPGGSLRLFDSVRRHALEGLAAGGGEAEARARHLAWMRARFERAEREEFGTPLLAWLPPLRNEVDNLRAALHAGLDGTPPPAVREDALRLAAASAMFWVRSGLRLEGLRWFTAARALPVAGETAVLLDHAWGIFVNHAQVGAPADALAALRRARPALQAVGDMRRLYLSLYAERMLLMRVAPQDDAAPLLAAMHACIQPGWGPLQRRYLDMLDGFALRDRGDFDGYRSTCAGVAQRCRAVGANAEAWPAENAQGQALALQGRLDEACTLLARTVHDVRAAGRLREQVPVLAIAASLHLQRGIDAAALALAADAVRLLQAEDMLWWMADALPWAALHAGRAADAARLQAWADELARARGDTRGPVFGGMRRVLLERLQALPEAAALMAVVEAGSGGLGEPAALALAFGAAA